MNITDIVIIMVILVSASLSWYRGFTREAISLCTWFSALIITYMFGLNFGIFLSNYINASTTMVMGLARVLLFAFTLVVGALINNLVSKFIKKSGLGSTDRNMGVLFGMARGVLVVMILAAGVRWFDLQQGQKWWYDSRIVPYILVIEQHTLKKIRRQVGALN
ncbi:MAG TPA: CvpA family protein [Pseudomonadales bacterium]